MQLIDNMIPDAPRYRYKLTHFDTGIAEISFWYDEPIGREHRRENQLYPGPRAYMTEAEAKADNVERVARRAKSKLRKLIMAIKSDRILTLTFRDNVLELDQARKYFVRFIKEVHKVYPGWQYVAVPERQKRGAWHFHLAVSGFQDVGFLRSTWWGLVGKAQGNIDVTSPRTRGDNRKGSALIAGYLNKYLAKTFSTFAETNKNRYYASQGIQITTVSGWFEAQTWREALAEGEAILIDIDGNVGGVYLSDDWLNGWFCSWYLGPPESKTRN